jgi:hypothetical protein
MVREAWNHAADLGAYTKGGTTDRLMDRTADNDVIEWTETAGSTLFAHTAPVHTQRILSHGLTGCRVQPNTACRLVAHRVLVHTRRILLPGLTKRPACVFTEHPHKLVASSSSINSCLTRQGTSGQALGDGADRRVRDIRVRARGTGWEAAAQPRARGGARRARAIPPLVARLQAVPAGLCSPLRSPQL